MSKYIIFFYVHLLTFSTGSFVRKHDESSGAGTAVGGVVRKAQMRTVAIVKATMVSICKG